MDRIRITYAKLSSGVTPQYFNHVGQRLLPASEFAKLGRFVRHSDRNLSFLGKLLLFAGLHDIGICLPDLKDLAYTECKKPFLASLSHSVSFNISHSGEFVVVAIALDQNIGIDIEENVSIEIGDYLSLFTPDEQIAVKNDPSLFYNIWTKKEAALKARGQGFHHDLALTEFSEDWASIDGIKFYFESVPVSDNYTCTIAFEKRTSSLSVGAAKVDEEFLSWVYSKCG